MLHQNPTRQPTLVRENDLRIERRLPVAGEVHVKVGERVEASTLVATGEQTPPATLINVARALDIEPSAAEGRLTKERGQAVHAGEVIARRRRGLRSLTVRSPFDGTFVRFDAHLGTALLRPHATLTELVAHVGGVIEEVEQGRGVTIRTLGSRFYGAFGVGDEAFGVLKIVGGDRQRPLGPELIDNRAARAILAVGGTVSAAALRKAAQVGVRGIIAGSIEESELIGWLGAKEATLWRVGLPDWRIPTADAPLTLVLTEGFGATAMAQPLYDTLTAADGMQGAISGVTRLSGGLLRPEVVVLSRSAGRAGEDLTVPLAALEPGTTVRLLDHDHLGVLATVAEAPRRRRLEGDLLLSALTVTLANGKRMDLPTANVEVLV
ncbi:MAG: hypothetical protein AVDCRST_MAG18-3687 [uncultured Thermomicrobiales bacterium]|uniref:Uncharacterized protein n=1 Tax=uncultured Thermomicrobiales bacterium TaxID=1645740 RepID=A0A6J4VQ82_9BACT|nr:MAG: hypothetical protein AVDCRST_MAG18-3687 [uncultured Thermomicrobiales bacterium]